jgi:hypothetical protein
MVSPELSTGSPWHAPVMPAVAEMHAVPPRCNTSKTTGSGRRAKLVYDGGELYTRAQTAAAAPLISGGRKRRMMRRAHALEP